VLLLFIAATIWGFAFVPQALTVEPMGPLWATAIRFALAVPVAWVAARGRPREGLHLPAALVLGVLLYVAFYLQTAAFKHTPVARISLITGTYALLAPLLAPLFGLARARLFHWLGVGLALSGLALLVGVFDAERPEMVPLNRGDVMTFGHALASAFHILLVGKLARTVNARVLNAVQITVMATLAVVVAAVVETPPPLSVFDGKLVLAFFYLAAFSSVLALTLQIAGQKTASAPVAAVIMLLESPLGAILAILLLHESMSLVQAAGGAVLVVGVAVGVLGERAEEKRAALVAS